ncbi:MAG TPA: two-component regulator propeller domain-containing protein [Blastocatellia bacterium]|nr:two-component regulator propeller domain-containing protein [Blastocatellia bacterium]
MITLHPPARAAQYRFDSWTTDNGLPQNSIRKIVQTPDGYLWFTTFDGLVRFDGVRFAVFDKGNTPCINSNRFTALYVNSDGALWAGTEDGSVVIYRDGVFTAYADGNTPNRRVILKISSDPQGEPLIVTSEGLFYLRGGQFISAPPEYDSPTSRYYRSSVGTLWILDQTGVRESKNGQATYYPLRINFVRYLHQHLTCYEDRQGRLWFGDYGHLYALKDGAVTRYDQQNGLPPLPADTVLRPYCEDDDGGLWLAGGKIDQRTTQGLLRFKDGHFTVYGIEAGLLNNVVLDICKDREGTLWLAVNGGLQRLRKQTINAYSTANGLLNQETYPLLETGDGDVLTGTIQGVSRFHNGRFTTVVKDAPKESVQALWKEPGGRLWIGAVGGLMWYENGRVHLHPEIKPVNTVWAIRSDRAGNLWVGSEAGLFKFRDGKVTAHYTTRDGLPSDDVKVILEARDGTLWLGTYGGLAALKDERFTAYTSADGLAGNRVRAIYEDAEGVLWIGTYDDGLSRFRDGRFFNYKVENGLFNNGVFQILEDRQGRFWMSSNKGISRVGRQQLNDFADGRVEKITCVAYGKQDGMRNSECNGGRQPAGIQTRDGKLWFPTMDGVVVIDPEAAPANELPPPVRIEQITTARSPLDISKDVILEPGQNDVEIAYTALSFIKPEQIKFKYRLEGKDDEWTDADTRRVAYYPYLPAGHYTFRVIAANQDGVWNLEGASIRIIIMAPFYERWWFLLACGGAVVAAALISFRARVAGLKKKQAAQEAFSRQLIGLQEQERKRIAAELHDSLSQNLVIIKNRALISLGDRDDAEQAFEQMEEISEAADQALGEVREIAHDLRPFQIDRLGLTRAIAAMVRRASTPELRFTASIDPLDGLLSPEMEINLYRIIQECINNIIKHAAASEAIVRVERVGQGVEIAVEDNGKGFTPASTAPGQSLNGSGFGLLGITERARILGSPVLIESAPGRGCKLSLKLSLKDGNP